MAAARCLAWVAVCAATLRLAHGSDAFEHIGTAQSLLISGAMAAVGAGNFSAALQGFHAAALAAVAEPYSPQQYLSTQNQLQILTHGCTHGTDSRYAADTHAVVHSSRSAADALVGVANAVLCARAKCAVWGLDADDSRVLILASLHSTLRALLVLHEHLETCRAQLPAAVWAAAEPTRLAATEMHWKGQVAVDAAGQLAEPVVASADHFAASASDLHIAFASVTPSAMRVALCQSRAPTLRIVCGTRCSADVPGLAELHAQRSLLFQLFQNLELALSFNTVYSDAPADFLAFLGLVAPLTTTPPFQRTDSPAPPNAFALGTQPAWADGRGRHEGETPAFWAEGRAQPVPLRLGVLSPDLRRHPVGWSAIGFLTALAGGGSDPVGRWSKPPAARFGHGADASVRVGSETQVTCFSFGGDDTRLVDPLPVRHFTADGEAGSVSPFVHGVWAHLHSWRHGGAKREANAEAHATAPATAVEGRGGHSFAQLLEYGEALQEYRHPLTFHYQRACHSFVDIPAQVVRAQQLARACLQHSPDSLSLSLLRRGGHSASCAEPDELPPASAGGAARLSPQSPRAMHVLLDLAGITAGGRPQLLRERAAPVQLHYMGSPIPPPMPGATDWFAADAVALPPDTLTTEAPAMLRRRTASRLLDREKSLPAGSARRSADAVLERLLRRVVATGSSPASLHSGAPRRTSMAALYLPVPFHCTTLFLPQHVVREGRGSEGEGSCAAKSTLAGAAALRWLEVQQRGQQLVALLRGLEIRNAAQSDAQTAASPSVNAAVHATFAHVLSQRQPQDVWLAAPLSASSVKREARMFDVWTNILRRTADCGVGRAMLVFMVPPQASAEAWRSMVARPRAAVVSPGQRDVNSRSHVQLDNEAVWGGAIYAALLQAGTPSRLLAEAAARGIPRERIIFLPDLQRELLPHVYALIDVQVDTRVYGGHSTAADALSHAVPVLTLPGMHMASRVTASFLAAVDSSAASSRLMRQRIGTTRTASGTTRPTLSALLTTLTLPAYEDAATRLVCQPQLRHALRRFLRDELSAIHAGGKSVGRTDASGEAPASGTATSDLFLPYTATPMLSFTATAKQLHRAALTALEAQTLSQVLSVCTHAPFCVGRGDGEVFPPHLVLP